MTVSISKMSINYYLQHAATNDGQAQDLTSYYTATEAPAGTWFGSGLSGLSATESGQSVTEASARAIYEHQVDPDTGAELGRPLMKSQQAPAGAKTPMGKAAKKEREGVAGFDLTFSPPKSVSALWAVAGPELQGRLHAAHRQATEETLRWVEREVLQSRAGHGGVAHVRVEGMVASLFDHWDSRAGDPQLHTHAVIANRVQRSSDGQWVTLDSYTLHRHVVAISELYNSVLYDRLYEQTGAVAESRSAETTIDIAALLEEHSADTAGAGSFQPAHRTELAAVPDVLIEEFSQRSAQIETRADELVAEWRERTGSRPSQAQVLKLRQQATLENRPDKQDLPDLTLPEKMLTWRKRAIAAGVEPDEVIRDAVGRQTTVITADMLDDSAVATVGQWALTDASQRRTTFTRANVRASAERVLRLVRCSSFEDREQLVDQVVNQGLDQAVSLTPSRSASPGLEDATVGLRGSSVFDHQRTAGVYTTETIMEQERYLIGRAEAEDAPSLSTVENLEEQLDTWRSDSGHRLSEDQYDASRQVLTSTAGVSAIIGPAGTGKTTTMSAITEAWQSHRGDSSVIGLAPSAVAAGVLGDEIGVQTDNVAKWLHESIGAGAASRAERVHRNHQRLERLTAAGSSDPQAHARADQLRAQLASDYADQAKYQMRKGQLLIVDEASMVSTAQLAELSRQADAAGTKVVLVGDPSQLEAVDAGGFLGHIERNLEHSTLDQVWRFRNEWEREASLRLRRGDTEVLDAYESQGRLHGDMDTDAAETAYSAWRDDQTSGASTILIASENTTVAELNARAHADRVEAGEVDIETTVPLRSGVDAGLGDLVLARRNDRNIRDSEGQFVANGTRMTIQTIRPDGSVQASVESSGASIVLDADYLASSVEHGYACTAHRAQGVTVDSAHAVVSPGLSRELFYVAMTRGKQANHAYVDFTDEHTHSPDTWEMMSQEAAGETPAEVLKSVVARSQAEKSAHEVGEHELGWANDVGRLCHEATYLDWASKLERTKEWIAHTYSAEHHEALFSDPDWQRLVNADPDAHHTGQVTPDDSIETILTRCQAAQAGAGAGPGGMLPEVSPAGDSQTQVWGDLTANAEDQIAARLAVLRRDPPQWLNELEARFDAPGQREHAVKAALVWRHVSGQEDEPSGFGTEPTRGQYLRPYWDRLQVALSPPPESPARLGHEQPAAEIDDDLHHPEPVNPILDQVHNAPAPPQRVPVVTEDLDDRQVVEPIPLDDYRTADGPDLD